MREVAEQPSANPRRRPLRGLAGLIACAAVALGLSTCDRHSPVTRDEASGAPTSLDVQISGCQTLRRGPVCELNEKRSLRLWVGGESAAIEAQSDRGPVPLSAPVAAGEGQRFEVTLPEGARRLSLSTRGPKRALWSIEVETKAPEPRLAQATVLRRQGRAAEADELLRGALATLGPDDRVRAEGLRARLSLDRGSAIEAAEGLAKNAEAARALGLTSIAVDDAVTAAFLFNVYGQRYLEARDLLARAEDDARDYPDGRARLPFHEGVLAHETGDGRHALRALNRARAEAERLGLDSLTFYVDRHAGLALASLGRYRDATARMGELGEAALAGRTPCDRVTVLLNAAWVALLARERGEAAGPAAPGPMLERALAEFSSGGCSVSYDHKNVLLDLALAALQAGDASAARRHLQASRAVVEPSPLLGFWQTDLEARLASLTHDNVGALATYRRQERLAGSGPWPAARWRALTGQGQTLEALGRLGEALAAYEKAEDVLDDELLSVPFGEGRTCLVGDREKSARGLVSVLTRLSRPRDAMDAARRARARLLRLSANAPRVAALPPDQRRRWEQALDAYARERKRVEVELEASWQRPGDRGANVENNPQQQSTLRALLDDAMHVLGAPARGPLAALPTPAQGEAFVAYFPGPGGAWLGFAADAEGARARELGAIDPRATDDELAARLFGPFESLLAKAKRIRLLPSGALRSVDLHALPFRGAPLVAHAPVAYGLDLPPEAAPVPAPDAAPEGPTVIADPTLDLAAARREGRHVFDALSTRPGPRPRLLEGREATRERLLESFLRSSLVHYAGHGVFEGTDGTESAMLLSGGERLTPGDLLTQPRAPARVVLSGCETARSPEGVGEGLGLAQAFLLRGASAVVAPTRPVGDESSSKLFEAFYRHFPEVDAPAALALAQNALRAASPGVDWRSFRALVP